MRYIVLSAAAVINLILAEAVFPNINIAGIAPDIIICTIASIALLEKSMTGAIFGLLCGLVMDVFSSTIGFYSMPYFVAGAAVYFVCNRVNYIDRFVLPFFFAIGAYVVKEFLSALLAYMMGIGFSLVHMFIRYILPEALLTGVFMLLVYFIFTKIYRSTSIKPKDSDTFKKFL